MSEVGNVLAKLSTTTAKHLGDFVGWSLLGSVDRETVHQTAETYGIEDDFGFPKVSANNAYRRALKKAVAGQRKNFAIVKLDETKECIVHAIIEKAVTAGSVAVSDEYLPGKDVQLGEVFRTRFDKLLWAKDYSAEDLLTISDYGHPLAQKIIAEYTELCVVYTVDDIRAAFQRAFGKWAGARVLTHGGLWYVPSTYAVKVRAWSQFIEDIGSTPIVIPIFDTEEALESLRAVTRESLDGQIALVRDELAGFSGGSHKTRTSTLEKRVETFDELRGKAELYETILGAELRDLREAIEDGQRALVQTIIHNESDGSDTDAGGN